MTDTYTCAACSGTFTKGWSDEEQAAAAKELFGTIPVTEMVTVCDDCFKEMEERRRVAEGIPLEAFRDGRDPFATRPIPNDE